MWCDHEICYVSDYSWHTNVGFLLSGLKSPAPSLPLTTDGEWETSYFRGSWVEGRTAGGSRNFLSHWQNPCFPFTVCDESAVTSGVNVRITLHQSRPDTDLHPIGFHIYKVSQTLKGNSDIFKPRPYFHIFTKRLIGRRSFIIGRAVKQAAVKPLHTVFH